MRLNLGCGSKLLEGFVNVDLADNWTKVPPDVVHDISKPLPFEPDSADEIHAYHVLEHFYRWEADRLLSDWKKVLKPGGLLVLELPSLDKILQHFKANPADERLTIWALYGDPKYKNPAMCHRWAYTYSTLRELLESVGFRDINSGKRPQTHIPFRDMRFEARK